MMNDTRPDNDSIDRLEGSLLATRLVLQVLLEEGLPQIRHNGDLIPILDAAQNLMASNLQHRSSTFKKSAQATIESLFKITPVEALD